MRWEDIPVTGSGSQHTSRSSAETLSGGPQSTSSKPSGRTKRRGNRYNKLFFGVKMSVIPLPFPIVYCYRYSVTVRYTWRRFWTTAVTWFSWVVVLLPAWLPIFGSHTSGSVGCGKHFRQKKKKKYQYESIGIAQVKFNFLWKIFLLFSLFIYI